MKRGFFFMAMIVFALGIFSQSGGTLEAVQKDRKELEEKIRRSDSLLVTTKKDVGSELGNLNLLNTKITERKAYLETVGKDTAKLNQEIRSLERQLKQLQTDLTEKRAKYASSVQYIYKNRTIEEKLLFILSAKTLSQTYRRMRYMQEYSNYQELQGKEILLKQEEVKQKKKEIAGVLDEKKQLVVDLQQEKKTLEQQEKEKKIILASLQKKQKSIQAEITQQRRQAAKLDARINKIIADDLARIKKEAMEEAKKDPPAPGVVYTMNKANRQLAANFEKNKGRLPIPVTGPYIIKSRYGQYAVEGLKNVNLDNKGINIQGLPQAKAKSIFDGVVTAVFQDHNSGLYGVLIRHGNYISMYANLAHVSVKKGEQVKTNQSIGEIGIVSGVPLLHFQLRKETAKLNPEHWIEH